MTGDIVAEGVVEDQVPHAGESPAEEMSVETVQTESLELQGEETVPAGQTDQESLQLSV